MSNSQLRLALVQENPVVGDLNANLQVAKSHIEKNQSSDLVVFPECFISGYPLNDLVLRPGFLSLVDQAINQLTGFVVELAGPAVLIGSPMAGTGLPYNAAYLIEPSGSVRVVRKAELPNSDVFDERRTFARATIDELTPLSFRGFNLGVQICEDMWHGRVSRALADELADVLISINGSPYNRGKDAIRKRHARTRVQATGLPLIYLNMVGGQDELVFDGGSFVMNANGGTMSSKAFATDTLHVTLARDEQGSVVIRGDIYNEISKYPSDVLEADYKATVLGVRDYLMKTGNDRVFVGVSGGLDSALVLTQAVDAIGADRVTGIMMPSKYTGDESKSLADDLMDRLGVTKLTIPISESFIATQEALGAALVDQSSANTGLMSENLQARIRGMILMGMTNAVGGIVLTTGNKSEMAVGYATLYGDMSGGYNPMKSVYKSDAFAMARWRNKVNPEIIDGATVSDPIPDGIISRPPTAELAEDQEDSNALGDYKALDIVLKALIEERLGISEVSRRLTSELAGMSNPEALTAGMSVPFYVAKIAKLVRIAQYKRVQSPPGVKLHPTDFGLGWRYPIAGNYEL